MSASRREEDENKNSSARKLRVTSTEQGGGRMEGAQIPSLDHFEILGTIGEGGFGRVRQVVL